MTLGALQGLTFALKRPEGDWEFNCSSDAEVWPSVCFFFVGELLKPPIPPSQAKQWYNDFKTAIDAWQLQELCNDKLERSKAKENCTNRSSTFPYVWSGLTFFHSFLPAALKILSASYGDLSDPKYSVEVTQLLQDMCDSQVRVTSIQAFRSSCLLV